VYQDGHLLNALARMGFKPATQPEKGVKILNQKHFFPYDVRSPDLMLREVDKFGVDFRNVFNQTPLMIAARFGNAHHVERLVEMGADTELVNNAGLSAFQIALEQACSNRDYAATKLGAIYERLEPADMVVQADERLHKLDKRSMEFLLLNLMIAMFYTHLGDRIVRVGGAFTAADFVDALGHFPSRLVPERRKARAYVSGILARNEVDRDDRYNRKLFFRVKHGNYVINPRLSVRVAGEWRAIYDLLSLDALGYRRHGPADTVARYLDEAARLGLLRFRLLIDAARATPPQDDDPPDPPPRPSAARGGTHQPGLFGEDEAAERS
jgi:hypothetical protein